MKWIDFPDTCFEVLGLPWFAENTPDLGRLPDRAKGRVREPVWNLGRLPSGGRIRFRSDTSCLGLRIACDDLSARHNMSTVGTRGFDAYVDGVYWHSAYPGDTGSRELVLFEGADRADRAIQVYLPLYQQVRVQAVGVDNGAEIKPAGPFSMRHPLVFYGSSVAQGAGACRPGMTYEAILARALDLDYVDLGFGGNGRAEPEMVDLINEVEACGYVFDLGKSYGMQSGEAYAAMLESVRASHPKVPVICVTPIFSTQEFFGAQYRDLSLHTRQVMREAAVERRKAGDAKTFLVEGTDLLGPEDADGFHEGVHPTDLGFRWMAERLAPVVRRAVFGEK